jgi:hypothetical protein
MTSSPGDSARALHFADFTLGAPHTIGGAWTQFQINFAAQGAGSTGRFAIVYTGPGDLANYVGVDTFAVAVPEPETWTLMLRRPRWPGRAEAAARHPRLITLRSLATSGRAPRLLQEE